MTTLKPSPQKHEPWLNISGLDPGPMRTEQGRRLAALKKEFLMFLVSDSQSPHSLRSASDDLNRFIQFVDREAKPLNQYERPDFNRFIASLQRFNVRHGGKAEDSWKLTPGTIRRIGIKVRVFLRYLYLDAEEKLIHRDLWSLVKIPPTEQSKVRHVDREDLVRMLNAPKIGLMNSRKAVLWKDGKDILRDKLFILLLYSSGLRVSEMGTTRVRDINFNTMSIKIIGKRNKERTVPIDNSVVKCASYYINVFKKGRSSFLFFSSPPSIKELMCFENKVNRRLKICAKVAGVPETAVSPHKLRHSFATDLYNNEADLKTIQELLGHSSLQSTQVYTHGDDARRKREYQKKHRPLES